MDSMITAAARALAAGDALGALNRVALRDDAPALAQLGDLARARALVRRAARAFGPKEVMARARCVVAEAEIALAARELGWPDKALEAARATLAHHGDHLNAAHAACLAVRRLVLIGRADDAERSLAKVDPAALPPALRAGHDLIVAAIALRRLRTKDARAALDRAQRAARQAGIPGLVAEVESVRRILETPMARVISRDQERALVPEEVEALLQSPALVVDARRHVLRAAQREIALTTRPVLFTIARALAEAWPGDVPRDVLVARAFRAKRADESYRARLRVEIGRLRRLLRPLASVSATPRGYALQPAKAREVLLLARPVDEPHADVLAFLADGESWSSSALALALGTGQRTVQRALDALAAAGKVHALGRGRARRWMTPPVPGFATTLLLPATLAAD